MVWHSISGEQAARELKSDINSGLSEHEAGKRLASAGENKLKDKKKPSVIRQFIAQFSDFCVIILFIACIISFATGINRNF